MRFPAVLWMALCMLLSACASHHGIVIESGDRYSTQAAEIGDYRLGAGDKVRMTVFNEPTLSGEFAVTSDGTVSLPLIGDLPAAGKRVTELASQAQQMFAGGYLREPRVSMEITTYRPFFILGEVKSPGQYPYATGMTVLNAVATAQGFTPRAEKSLVYIRRAGAAEEEAYRLTPEIRVFPGDTIRLGERYF